MKNFTSDISQVGFKSKYKLSSKTNQKDNMKLSKQNKIPVEKSRLIFETRD